MYIRANKILTSMKGQTSDLCGMLHINSLIIRLGQGESVNWFNNNEPGGNEPYSPAGKGAEGESGSLPVR